MTPPTLLLPQILTKAQKRVYPSYNYTRTLSLFPSRAALLAYEKALLLETEVDDALGEQETLNGRRPFSKNGEGKAVFGSGLGRREGAEVVRAIWELVWDRWRTVVAQAQKEGMEREGARTVSDRFQPGASSPARFPDRSAVGISTTDFVLPRRLPARRPRPDPNRLQGCVRARRPARLQRRVRRPACATRPESLAAR
jgi:hypothetical protein